VANHTGVSHRTQMPLTNKEHSSIREHAKLCKVNISGSDFKILGSADSELALRVLESIYIKRKRPMLNDDGAAVPLLIA